MLLRMGTVIIAAASIIPVARTQTFTSIDYPGALTTTAQGINDSGQIVGYYQDGSGFHGFLYSGGEFSQIDAVFPGAYMTTLSGINNSGQIVGDYHTSFDNIYGFVLAGGIFSPISYPGAIASGPGGINNSGEMAGNYATLDCCVQFGFLYSNGVYTSLDSPPVYDQSAYGINDTGQIVGFYIANNDSTFTLHGFVDNGGAFTSIDYPGASGTIAHGINNSGQIVGMRLTPNYHAFLYSGAFTPIDYPGGTLSAALGINNLGQVVGYYLDAASRTHGFLYTPPAAPTVTTASNVTVAFSPAGQTATLTAFVASGGVGVNGGIVTFSVPGIPGSANSAPVQSGAASANFFIPAGYHTGSFSIDSAYSGYPGLAASTDSTKFLTIIKATPKISWAAPAAITFGSALGPTQLNATANVPGTFGYSPPAGTVLAAGNNQSLSTAFTPADLADYGPAQASVTIDVNQASQSSGGSAQLVLTRTLSRNAANDIVATLTIANTGGGAASNVVVTVAKIGSTAASTQLPLSAGGIGAGSSTELMLIFPSAAGLSGASMTVTFAGTYTGGSFSSTPRVILP